MTYRIILLYFILMAQVSGAKTATVKAYGMQFSVPPTRTSDGSNLYFTSYDGSTSYPLQDSTTNFISNEFRQQSTGSPVFRADYLAGDAYNTYEYGSISYTISSTDSDGNGVPDWLQKENSVNLSISGVPPALGKSVLGFKIFVAVPSHEVQEKAKELLADSTGDTPLQLQDIGILDISKARLITMMVVSQ